MPVASGTAFPLATTYTGSTAATIQVDVGYAKNLSFIISGLSTETVTLDVNLDGQTWATGVMPTLLTTNANPASTALGNGAYQFGAGYMPCRYIRFTKSGSANTVTIIYGFRL